MKSLLATIGCALILGISPVAKSADLNPHDSTSLWKYPYSAPNEKEERIRTGAALLLKEKPGVPASRFIEVLGPADQVDDLAQRFQGMSPAEDGMLVRYRQYLSHRLVWYVAKQAGGHSLNDVWFAAYVENGDDKVVKVVSNGLK